MASIPTVINAKDILVGTGKVFVNGVFIGDIIGDFVYNREATTQDIKARGVFPQPTVDTIATEIVRQLTFGLHEMNYDVITMIRADFEATYTSAGFQTATDLVGPMTVRSPGTLSNRFISQTLPFTAYLGAKLTKPIMPTDTLIFVTTTNGFSVGDDITFTEGAQVITKKIAAVDIPGKVITVSSAVSGSFSLDAVVQSETALTRNVDYYVNFAFGWVERATGSVLLAEGGYAVFVYSHETFAGRGIQEISPKEDKIFAVDFYHKRRDGDYVHARWQKAKSVGTFSLTWFETEETNIPVEIDILDAEPASVVLTVPAEAVPGGGW